jgi:hypothetical protein
MSPVLGLKLVFAVLIAQLAVPVLKMLLAERVRPLDALLVVFAVARAPAMRLVVLLDQSPGWAVAAAELFLTVPACPWLVVATLSGRTVSPPSPFSLPSDP